MMSKNEQENKKDIKKMILARTIGIFYSTEEWLELLIKMLLSETSAQAFKRTKDKIFFADGTVIYFVKEGNEAVCKERFDKVYAEEDISVQYFFSMIIPCCGGDGYLNTFVIKKDFTAVTRFDWYLCRKSDGQ